MSVASARREPPGEPVALGSRAVFSGRLLGQTLESETRVIEFEPPRLFATRAIRGPKLTTRFAVEPESEGTRLHVEVSGDVPGGALGARLAEGFLRKELITSLQRLREIAQLTLD